MLSPPPTPSPPPLRVHKMLSPPPPPLPGPGGLDAYHHILPPGVRRNLSNHEVAEYLSSRKGERDIYYLCKGRTPSQTHWAVMLHRHPLLACRVQVRGESIAFVHTPSPDIPSAREFAAARSHHTPGDLVGEFHKRRYLANDKLAYLITGDRAYLLVVAACIVGLMEWADELSREVQDEEDEERLLSALEGLIYPTEEAAQARVIASRKLTLADAVAAVTRCGTGGQSMSGPSVRRTAYIGPEATSALLSKCHEHGISISHVLVAACAVAYAQRAPNRREPIHIRLSSNHSSTRRISNIFLSCLCPYPPEIALWRRAKQAARCRGYNPLAEAQRARSRAAAEDLAATQNPGLGLGIIMPQRRAPQPSEVTDKPTTPPEDKVLLAVNVDVGDGSAHECGTRMGPALTVVVRDAMTLVFTDVPEIFVDDVLALLQS